MALDPSKDHGRANDALSLGPRMPEFVSMCMEKNGTVFVSLWVSASIAVFGTLITALLHNREMTSRSPSILRWFYRRVSYFAPVLGFTALYTLFCPRVWAAMDFVGLQAEAVSLAAFGNVLLLILAQEAAHASHAQGSDVSGGTIGQKVMRQLNKDGPKLHFGVPPLGCFFRPCMTPHLLKPWHMLLARQFVRQFAFIVVLAGLVRVWGALAMEVHAYSVVTKWSAIISKLSGFFAIYGLFIVYAATHTFLEKWQPTAKFVALKSVVFLMTFQELILEQVLKFVNFDNTCLVDREHDQEAVTSLHRLHWVQMYLICWESLLVATLVRRAFTAKDLPNESSSEEYCPTLVEIDLERMEDSPESESESSEDEISPASGEKSVEYVPERSPLTGPGRSPDPGSSPMSNRRA